MIIMNSRIAASALLTVSLLAACSTGTPTPPVVEPEPGPYGTLTNLKPGERAAIKQKLRVNIVSIGYRPTVPGQVAGPRDLNFEAVKRELPKTYTTKNRYPSFYGNAELTGNDFEFDYRYVAASSALEDEFFNFLTENGEEKGLVEEGVPLVNYGAALYNCQTDDPEIVVNVGRPPGEPTPLYACLEPAPNIVREVTGNHEIDGALVEQWLADNLGKAGVDTSEHTVVLINWYGRQDFKFHSYSHLRPETIETDTGVNFGARSSRRTIAWGGTPAQDQAAAKRLWFIDSSANPDFWTSSWNISDADVDGDEIYDKRLPPIWEYGTRKNSVAYAEKISADLGKVIRYVGINLLFTPSPLYRVELTPPLMPEQINLDVAVEQGDGAPDPLTVFQPEVARDRVSVLHPFASWSVTTRTLPLDGDLANAYRCFFPLPTDDACSPEFADANGQLFFEQALADIRARAAQNPGVYNIPTYLFNDADEEAVNRGLLGRAVSDGVTGTQTFTNNFLTPLLKSAGYGFTDTVVHETGHHLSQSHPHDGYDSERDEDFGPSGDTRFVDVGDEVDSVMSYMNLSKTFGQFNLDAQYRYLTAAYMTNTNAILSITDSADKESLVKAAAKSADAKFGTALTVYAERKYLDAARLAHDAYREVVVAAQAAGVDIDAYKWYERVEALSLKQAQPRAVNHYRPIVGQGPVMRPEETPFLRSKRLAD